MASDRHHCLLKNPSRHFNFAPVSSTSHNACIMGSIRRITTGSADQKSKMCQITFHPVSIHLTVNFNIKYNPTYKQNVRQCVCDAYVLVVFMACAGAYRCVRPLHPNYFKCSTSVSRIDTWLSIYFLRSCGNIRFNFNHIQESNALKFTWNKRN